MTTSVCMGIYNGEKYIEQQLLTILRQSKTVDEVILCDDGSNDGTVAVVERFIRDNHLQNTWKLIVNKKNKGYPENFYYAMSLCTKDVVFLADQDDIWHSDKIEKMCDVLEKYPEAKTVCCKFGLIDADGNKIRSIMQPAVSKGSNEVKNITIEAVFYKCEWPGMVMAYRREWYEQRVAVWSGDKSKICGLKIPHDFLVCAWAAEEEEFLQMDTELAWHRRHGNNIGGEEHRIGKLLSRERKLREIEKYCSILNKFGTEKVLFSKAGKKALSNKVDCMQKRYDALKSGKTGRVIKNAWIYRSYTRRTTLVCDILITIISR